MTCTLCHHHYPEPTPPTTDPRCPSCISMAYTDNTQIPPDTYQPQAPTQTSHFTCSLCSQPFVSRYQGPIPVCHACRSRGYAPPPTTPATALHPDLTQHPPATTQPDTTNGRPPFHLITLPPPHHNPAHPHLHNLPPPTTHLEAPPIYPYHPPPHYLPPGPQHHHPHHQTQHPHPPPTPHQLQPLSATHLISDTHTAPTTPMG